jgi:hypothetical protein
MVIDTGDHQPIAVAKPHYGIHEAPIMQNMIKRLLDMGFIVKDSISPWGFRITLAPKPHQENVTEIENYVWRFCTNYICMHIRLNMITSQRNMIQSQDVMMQSCSDSDKQLIIFFLTLTQDITTRLGYPRPRLSKQPSMPPTEANICG